MKIFHIILPLLVLLSACDPFKNTPTPNEDKELTEYDSVYVIADIQWHKQYYPKLDKQVFSIDLLTEGLAYDSAYHITGTGVNLYFSDIFLPLTDTLLQEGIYQMDSTAEAKTFLPYMHFEGNITGCYMLDIQEDQIKRIIGFSAGQFEIRSLGEDIRMDILLYLADSTRYRATYQGPALYR
jgi:hypothetical protein